MNFLLCKSLTLGASTIIFKKFTPNVKCLKSHSTLFKSVDVVVPIEEQFCALKQVAHEALLLKISRLQLQASEHVTFN